MATNTRSHVEVVDGLRGCAVVLVLLFHYRVMSSWTIPLPWGRASLDYVANAGVLGVELFFFLSAFCLFYPYVRATATSSSAPALRNYVYRRAIKILPSYWLSMAVILVFFPHLFGVSPTRGRFTDVVFHLLFIHNFFPDTAFTINTVFWSLSVEVQFYVVFPALAWLFLRRPGLTFLLMSAIGIGYRFWSRHQAIADFDMLNNQLPAFFDLFAAGMLSAYLIVWVRQRAVAAHQLRWIFTLCGVGAFSLALMMFRWLERERAAGPWYWAWESLNRQWFALLFALVVVASSYGVPAWRRVLANRVLVFLSLISYNLYIWHVVVGFVIRDHHWVAARTATASDDPTWRWEFWVVGMLASVLVATLITYCFERPLLKHGVRGVLARLSAPFSRTSAIPDQPATLPDLPSAVAR